MRLRNSGLVLLVSVFLITLGLGSMNQASAVQPEGNLYAASQGPAKVFRYKGGAEWEAISGELGASVDAIVIYNGQLFAAAGQDMWNGPSVVYRYDGGTTWSAVSDVLDARIEDLAVYKGRLYASTMNSDWNMGKLFRYDGDFDWAQVADSSGMSSGWHGFRTMYVWNDYLYLGDSNTDYIARFDGEHIEQVSFYGGSCIWAMEGFQDELFAGAYAGYIYRSTDGVNFSQQRLEMDYNHIWSMETFLDDLYIGLAVNTYGSSQQLYRWNNGSPQSVWQGTGNGREDGVISMATNGETLFFGTGVSAGYYSGSGNGAIYAYDGQNVTALSGTLSYGINQLALGALTPPRLEIADASVKPSPMLAGGTFLAYISLRNAGDESVYIGEDGFSAIDGLPAGWTGEFIDVGRYGEPYGKSVVIEPGGTGTVVVAITVPAGAAAGAYPFSPSLTYQLGSSQSVFEPAGDYSPVAVVVKSKLLGNEMSFYRRAESAARQIRALDRNIEEGIITTSIDLTYVGIDGAEKTVTVRSEGGYAYYYESYQRYYGSEYSDSGYYAYSTTYALAGYQDYGYESKVDDYSYRYSYDYRPYYVFDLTAIPAGSQILGAKINFYTGYSYPYGNFYVDIYSMETDPATSPAQTVYEDTANGVLYADNLYLRYYGAYTMDLTGDFLSAFIAATGGKFAIGLNLDRTLSDRESYEYEDDYYRYWQHYSYIYSSYGQNPTISTDTLQFTDPEEAMHIVLDLYLQCKSGEANTIATYINEKYYSIGYWGLAPGQDQGNEGNRQK